MRELTEDETRVFFEKLSKYVGRNITYLIERTDEPHCFRLQNDRVYYVSDRIMRLAESMARDNLASLGVCFGKFTKSSKFRLHITCLDYLAQYAKYKVWLKPTAEMSYLYGNNILKAHVERMTDETPEYQGIVVYSTRDLPLGFAVSAKSATACANLDPTGIVGFHQADVGEYLRGEDTLI